VQPRHLRIAQGIPKWKLKAGAYRALWLRSHYRLCCTLYALRVVNCKARRQHTQYCAIVQGEEPPDTGGRTSMLPQPRHLRPAHGILRVHPIYTHTHTHTYKYKYINIYIYIIYIYYTTHTHIYKYIYIYIYIYILYILYIYMYIYIYIYMHIHYKLYICIYIHICIHRYLHISTYIYICMGIYT